MNESIKNLVDFVNNLGEEPVAEVANLISGIDRQRMRVVAMKLLLWLKDMRTLGTSTTLPFNPRFQWCQDLLHLINDKGLLRDVIQVREDGFALSPDLSKEEREELVAFVDGAYRPKIHYTPRRVPPENSIRARGEDT